ncbi:DUF2922 domain-containing protein [Lysinibacillus antri]|uniref:DUF2922 domain-containing protein n=1 Tax=Lysinibacillus antri TaxID=2498145 RepID=A0A3S0WE20_9BACI|nr:DUF2922 domain-containing protein [Lysinibacillus antri]RUL46536.1 DUF2922 domain-containing protein [Lysinibacillus antri]
MAETKTILQLDFISHEGKTVSIKLADPREDLTAEEIQNAMEQLNNTRVLYKIHGAYFVPAKIKGAKFIDTVTNEFDIEIE